LVQNNLINLWLFGLSSGYNRDVHLFEEWLGSPENQAFFEPEAG
jgi:hypothetical protein